MLFSSHILQEVEAICDRVIIINKGNIVADDNLQNLHQSVAGKTTIILALKEAVEKEVMLAAFGEKVQNISATKWKFETVEPETIKKQILEFTLQENLNIVSLQSETRDLEEVFRTLTNNAVVPLGDASEQATNLNS